MRIAHRRLVAHRRLNVGPFDVIAAGSRLPEERSMQYVCDAGPKTWFRLETEGEAERESRDMDHAVEKYFRQSRAQAEQSYVPSPTLARFEQKIGLKDYILRVMPLFLTLRDRAGTPLATAMLPPGGKDDKSFRPIIVGTSNGDPYQEHGDAIALLGAHFKLTLDPVRCFPYRRG